MGPNQTYEFLHSNGYHKKKKNEKATTEWEKIFVGSATDKGLISKIYKQLITTQQQQRQPR